MQYEMIWKNSPEEIPEDIRIMIKKGSTLPVDEVSKFEMAKELAGADKIDPLTLFEEMGYSNPEKRVMDLYKWYAIIGKIDIETLKMVQNMSTNEEGDKAAKRIQGIIDKPGFRGLPPEEQQQYVDQAREILSKTK